MSDIVANYTTYRAYATSRRNGHCYQSRWGYDSEKSPRCSFQVKRMSSLAMQYILTLIIWSATKYLLGTGVLPMHAL